MIQKSELVFDMVPGAVGMPVVWVENVVRGGVRLNTRSVSVALFLYLTR